MTCCWTSWKNSGDSTRRALLGQQPGKSAFPSFQRRNLQRNPAGSGLLDNDAVEMDVPILAEDDRLGIRRRRIAGPQANVDLHPAHGLLRRGSQGRPGLAVDGSFVTAKEEPEDVDAVMLAPAAFTHQVEQGLEAALELQEMFSTRQPEEIFAAEDDADWQAWYDFFSRTRETDNRRKGLVEVLI